jgi:glyceraldehyde 3-phosphate dehydrogenase
MEDKRRGRAAAENVVPQASRSAEAAVEILPELAGRLTGYAMNVPVSNASVVDLVCWHEKPATRDAINAVVRDAASSERWKGVLEFETEPIVSSDVARSEASATFDSLATMTLGDRMSKTLSWFGAGLGQARRAIEIAERCATLEARR